MDNKLIISGALILTVLIAILGVQLNQGKTIESPSVSATERYPFQSISRSDIASFAIETSKFNYTFKKIKLAEGASYFGIVEKNNYPADGIKTNNLINSLLKTVLVRKIAVSEKVMQDCGLTPEYSKTIVLYKKDGTTLTQLFLGKKASTGGNFLRLGNALEKIYLTEDPIWVPTKSESWEDLRFPRLSGKTIQSIHFSFPREGNKISYSMARKEPKAPLEFTNQEATIERPSKISNFLSSISIDQLVLLSPKETGIDNPVQVVEYKLKGNASVKFSIGNVLPYKKEDRKRRRYVAIDFQATQKTPEALKPVYQDWKKRSGNHIFLLKDSITTNLLNFNAPILEDLSNAVALTISQKEKSVQLKKENGEWKVSKDFDFPADQDKVQELLNNLALVKSRPGDFATLGTNSKSYMDNGEGSLHYQIKMADGTETTLIQGKIRAGIEVDNEEEYRRVYQTNEIADATDEWGQYYIKPTGNITLGTRGPAGITVKPADWLKKHLGNFPQEELSLIQLKQKGKEFIWQQNAKGKFIASPQLPEKNTDELLEALGDLEIYDIVSSQDKEKQHYFASLKEPTTLTIKNKSGVQLELILKGKDSQGLHLGKISAIYSPPAATINPLKAVQEQKAKLATFFKKVQEDYQAGETQLLQANQQAKTSLVESQKAREELDKCQADQMLFSTSLTEKQKEVMELTTKLTAKTKEQEATRLKVKTSQATAEKLATEVKALPQEDKVLVEKAKQAQATADSLAKQLAEQEKETTSLKQRIAAVSKQKAEIEKTLAALELESQEKSKLSLKLDNNAKAAAKVVTNSQKNLMGLKERHKEAKENLEKINQAYEEIKNSGQEAEWEKQQNDLAAKAATTKEYIKSLNDTFTNRILRFDYQTAQKLHAAPLPKNSFKLSQFDNISLQTKKEKIGIQQKEKGIWKIGDKYANLEQIQLLFEKLNALEFRMGNKGPNLETPELTIILKRKDQQESFKIGKPFKITDEEEHYRFVQWNNNSYLLPEEDFSLTVNPTEWEDLRLVRLKLKELNSVEITYPEKNQKHLFLVKNGTFEFADLAKDHGMLAMDLEKALSEVLAELKPANFKEKTAGIKLVNVIKLEHLNGDITLRFSEPNKEGIIFLSLNATGIPGTNEINTKYKDRWCQFSKEKFEKFALPREELESLRVYVSHILVTWSGKSRMPITRSKEEAEKRIQEVLAKLKDPKADFKALAKTYSDEPSAKQSGGMLPYPIQKDSKQYVEPFKNAALNLKKVGEISSIIETEFGFHILKRDQ